MLVPPWYMLQMYDRVLTSYDENTLLGLSLIALFLYVVYGLLERFRSLLLIKISEEIEETLGKNSREKVFSADTTTPSTEHLLDDLDTVKSYLTGQPILWLLDAPWAAIFISAIYLLHPAMGHLAVAGTVTLIAITILHHKITKKNLLASENARALSRNLIAESVSGKETIQVMSIKEGLSRRLEDARAAYTANLLTASIQGSTTLSFGKFFRLAIQSAMLGLGAYLAINNHVTPGMMIAGSILLGRALAPVEGIINFSKNFSDFRSSYRILAHEINYQGDSKKDLAFTRLSGEIEMKNVSVSLGDNRKTTLQDIEIKVVGGDTIAILGKSGSGKTTLLKTMAGLIFPSDGRILIDGQDTRNISADKLGKNIGFLGEQVQLFSGTISENISRFSGEKDLSLVMKAARQAGAHQLITSLPDGYETLLGYGGLGLSEGQNRRVGLSRALYGNPVLVFLDEPGRGLDGESLKSVTEAISSLKNEKTTLIFSTHQLRLAELADKILILEEGRLSRYGDMETEMKRIVG